MKQRTAGNIIASTQWDARTYFYVAQVKGDENPKSDWGYTTDYTKALPLNKHFARMFAADTLYCGRVPVLRTI